MGDDSSPEAARAGELATGIGKLFGARALLLGLSHDDVQGQEGFALADVGGATEKRRRIAERAGGRTGRYPGYASRDKVVRGDAAAAIQETAEEGGEPALVAVGSRGLGAVRRFALGSVSTDVLRAVGGPILIVPLPKDESQ